MANVLQIAALVILSTLVLYVYVVTFRRLWKWGDRKWAYAASVAVLSVFLWIAGAVVNCVGGDCSALLG
jgi:hypothetical protein